MLRFGDREHLDQMLNVRQSTLQQVLESTESTSRKSALHELALALGWSEERIVVIAQDLGFSGTSTADRLGFQCLVTGVGLGQVGLVLGLEISRLARNSSDWHQLLDLEQYTLDRHLPVALHPPEAQLAAPVPTVVGDATAGDLFAGGTVGHAVQHMAWVEEGFCQGV